MLMSAKRNIIKGNAKSDGTYDKLTFLVTNEAVSMCCSAIEVDYTSSQYVLEDGLHLSIGLKSNYFSSKIRDIILNNGLGVNGKEMSFPVEVVSEQGKSVQILSSYLTEQELLDQLGLEEQETADFKQGLADELANMSRSVQMIGKDFRTKVIRKAGSIQRIIFKPKDPILASRLKSVEICLDLSSYIDLDNKPKKGKKLEQKQVEVYQQALKEGKTETEAKTAAQAAILEDPVFDLMLNLYPMQGEMLPLGMYTHANDQIKFSNGTEVNDYTSEFLSVGIGNDIMKDFKVALKEEIVAILRENNKTHLDNSILGLNLEEPWAKDPTVSAVSDLDERTIKVLRDRVNSIEERRQKRQLKKKSPDLQPV